ncbi:MAG TPA: methylated-DNA--[protein]-cysteine S-methyltransferase [Longimicrobiales bacterium]|nr:methylated-DNA--[protein]-cysteine S-methyltransferase [Longimicrobiales bacterium]
MSAFNEAVYRLVTKCPKGKVVSYGGVAAMLGKPRAARAVGAALRDLPDGSKVPWWRVINSRGEISIRGLQRDVLQRELLLKEGVRFSNNVRIDWETFGWEG